MTDIVRLLQLDHHIARTQFDDLFAIRATGDPGELDTSWAPLATLLRSHVEATGHLIDNVEVDVDHGRRARLAAAAAAVDGAIQLVERERCGTRPWWAAVSALQRTVGEMMIASDRSLVDLLRAALDNHERDALGQAWLERHGT